MWWPLHKASTTRNLVFDVCLNSSRHLGDLKASVLGNLKIATCFENVAIFLQLIKVVPFLLLNSSHKKVWEVRNFCHKQSQGLTAWSVQSPHPNFLWLSTPPGNLQYLRTHLLPLPLSSKPPLFYHTTRRKMCQRCLPPLAGSTQRPEQNSRNPVPSRRDKRE